MSVSYWGIIGYGLCIDDIYKFINHEKVKHYIKKMVPEIEIDEDVFDDVFCGDPYSNFGEFLCELDKDSIFTWDDDGGGRAFFLYAPPYPWQMKDNEPVSVLDCENRMIDILKMVCDAPEDELRNCIDYINETGCG